MPVGVIITYFHIDGLRSVDRVLAYVHHATIGKAKEDANALETLPASLKWDDACALFNALCPDRPYALTAKDALTFRVTGFRQSWETNKKHDFTSDELARLLGSGATKHCVFSHRTFCPSRII